MNAEKAYGESADLSKKVRKEYAGEKDYSKNVIGESGNKVYSKLESDRFGSDLPTIPEVRKNPAA